MKRAIAAAGLLLLIGACAFAGTASAAYVKHADVNYDLDSPPAPASPAGQNTLDIYVPSSIKASARRPVVVFVHGGGWKRGDKKNNPLGKARLFTEAGYVYATINYRLSPVAGEPAQNPGRVKFPDHPHDVGEALCWLDRHAGDYGGDAGRMILAGHSAGAHLVSLVGADPGYTAPYGVLRSQLRRRLA